MSNKIKNLFKVIVYILSFLLLFKLLEFPGRYFLESSLGSTNLDQLSSELILFWRRLLGTVAPTLPSFGSLIFGVFLGYWKGLAIISIADLLAFNFNFFIGKIAGRSLIKKLFSQSIIQKYDIFCQKHLEKNFFSIVFLLMFGAGDFLAYFIGATSVRWRCYILALSIRIILINPAALAMMSKINPARLILSVIIVFFLCLAIFRSVQLNYKAQN